MNAIMVGAAGPEARCRGCGEAAVTNVRLQGQDADAEAQFDLCDSCRSLLGQMLVDAPRHNENELRNEVLRLTSGCR